MFNLSAGTFSASIAAAGPSLRSTRLARMARCNSSSVGTACLLSGRREKRTSVGGLAEQHIEGRHVGVPLDQGWNRTEPCERLAVQRPHLGDDVRAVIVDTQGAAIGERPHTVTCKVDFPDCRRWQRGQIGGCIPAMVMGTDIDVVHVA